MNLDDEIKEISNQIIKLAEKNNISIRNIGWLMNEVQKTIYEKAGLKIIN